MAQFSHGVNLTISQGVNARQHWLSGVLWGLGCSGGAETPGIHLPCFGRIIGVKCLFINYLTQVVALETPVATLFILCI